MPNIIYYALLSFFCLSHTLTAQNDSVKIYNAVDEAPRFPGCEDISNVKIREACAKSELQRYIDNHLVYPESLIDEEKTTVATITVVITSEGTISSPQFSNRTLTIVDSTAMDIVQQMMEDNITWTPGKLDDETVNTTQYITVAFRLSEDGVPLTQNRIEALRMEEDMRAAEAARAAEQTSEEPTFKVVEEMPRFPGCEDITDPIDRKSCSQNELLKYIYRQIRVPNEAVKANVNDVSVISFIIETDGTVSNVRIQREIGYGCDEEALRAVETMAAEITWSPGRQRGIPVRVQFNMPIKFRSQ